MNLKKIEHAILALPSEDKVALIVQLEQSLSSTEHERIWADEAIARLNALKEGRAGARDAFEFLDELRSNGAHQ